MPSTCGRIIFVNFHLAGTLFVVLMALAISDDDIGCDSVFDIRPWPKAISFSCFEIISISLSTSANSPKWQMSE